MAGSSTTEPPQPKVNSCFIAMQPASEVSVTETSHIKKVPFSKTICVINAMNAQLKFYCNV
jgi:hypothetical protein